VTKMADFLDIGKHLDCSRATGEAIGIYLFRKEGAEMFRNIVEEMMLEPDGLKKWYPLAVGELAKRIYIATTDITGCCWSEIDFPEDLKKQRKSQSISLKKISFKIYYYVAIYKG